LDYGGWDDWRLWSVTDVGNDGCNVSFDGTECGYNIDTAISELGHLWYETLGNLAYLDTSGNVQPGGRLQNTGPFQNFEVGWYWSGTEYAPYSDVSAWFFFANNGFQSNLLKEDQLQAWAVRPGQVDVAALDAQPVPTPGTLWLAGAGLLGLSLRRRRWVLRRFV
ncbi:MAG: PEP-CTERM sorting domain-containing protein, partial [Halochromatium sp.]